MKQKGYVLRGKHKMGGYFYMADYGSAGMVYDAEDKSTAIVFEDKDTAEHTCRKMNNYMEEHGIAGPRYRVVCA